MAYALWEIKPGLGWPQPHLSVRAIASAAGGKRHGLRESKDGTGKEGIKRRQGRERLPHRRPPPQGTGLRPRAARALAPAARDAPCGMGLPEQQGGWNPNPKEPAMTDDFMEFSFLIPVAPDGNSSGFGAQLGFLFEHGWNPPEPMLRMSLSAQSEGDSPAI